MSPTKGLIAVTGAACLFLSFGLNAQTAQGRPGGGTSPTPQDVNVVNTPTVNIGTGGPIGVDVLTMPSQTIAITTPAPKAVTANLTVQAGSNAPISFTYTPESGKRAVVQNFFVTEETEIGCLSSPTFFYEGGYQFLRYQPTPQYVGLEMALPPGPFTLTLKKNCTHSVDFVAHILITIYEFPAN